MLEISISKVLVPVTSVIGNVPSMMVPLKVAQPAVLNTEPCEKPWLASVTPTVSEPSTVVNGLAPSVPLVSVQTLDEWKAFRNRYGVLRNSGRFWSALDWFNDWNFKHRGEEAGYLDLSYYDLLDTVY